MAHRRQVTNYRGGDYYATSNKGSNSSVDYNRSGNAGGGNYNNRGSYQVYNTDDGYHQSGSYSKNTTYDRPGKYYDQVTYSKEGSYHKSSSADGSGMDYSRTGHYNHYVTYERSDTGESVTYPRASGSYDKNFSAGNESLNAGTSGRYLSHGRDNTTTGSYKKSYSYQY